MQSPFPGMDPFLEAPTNWGEFHARFIHALSDALVALVAPHFVVSVEKHVYISAVDDITESSVGQIVPDVFVYQQPKSKPRQIGESASAYAPIYIEPIAPVKPLDEPELHQYYLEIREPHQHEVITTIELLSPFNKAAGTRGRTAFVRKRKVVMTSRAHWLEIDLLREGERPAEVRGRSDYYTLLKRADDVRYEVCYVNLRDPLPTIAVPLRTPFEDVLVDLSEVFNTTYMRGQFASKLDYDAVVPTPRLSPADESWIRGQVTTWRAVQ